jgi:aromatic ring hydroxylase
MRTEKEYRERLYSYKRNIFMKGERVGRDHPQFEPAVNLIAESFRLAMDPEYADLFTVTTECNVRNPDSNWARP